MKEKVDILAAGGHKWLLNPFGAGLLYVRGEHLANLDPPYINWSNVKPPRQGWYEVLSTIGYTPIKKYEVRTDTAKKYSIPSTNIEVGIPALASSLNYINRIGIKNIEKRILHLTDILIDNLDQNKIELTSPIEKKSNRSGIVSVKTRKDKEILSELKTRKIIVSLSYASGSGGIRVSPHFFNTEEEVLRCCKEINKLVN